MSWKGVLKVFIGIFLFISLLSLVFSFALFQVTSYNNLEPRFHDLLEQGIGKQMQGFTADDWNNQKAEFVKKCVGKEEIVLPTITDASSVILKDLDIPKEIRLSCSGIGEITIEDLINVSSKQMFYDIYYRNLSCDFIKCFSEKEDTESKGLFLVSKKANDFFALASIILIIATLLFMVLIFILSQPRYISFYVFAPIFMIVGLPFLVFLILKIKMPSLLGQFSGIVVPMMNTFFINFLVAFCLGVIFLILAIIFASVNRGKNEKKK
jgi:hypothetical protein